MRFCSSPLLQSAWISDLIYPDKNVRQILGPDVKKLAVFNLPVLGGYPETPMGGNWSSFLEGERPHARELEASRELPTLTARSARKTVFQSGHLATA